MSDELKLLYPKFYKLNAKKLKFEIKAIKEKEGRNFCNFCDCQFGPTQDASHFKRHLATQHTKFVKKFESGEKMSANILKNFMVKRDNGYDSNKKRDMDLYLRDLSILEDILLAVRGCSINAITNRKKYTLECNYKNVPHQKSSKLMDDIDLLAEKALDEIYSALKHAKKYSLACDIISGNGRSVYAFMIFFYDGTKIQRKLIELADVKGQKGTDIGKQITEVITTIKLKTKAKCLSISLDNCAAQLQLDSYIFLFHSVSLSFNVYTIMCIRLLIRIG